MRCVWFLLFSLRYSFSRTMSNRHPPGDEYILKIAAYQHEMHVLGDGIAQGSPLSAKVHKVAYITGGEKNAFYLNRNGSRRIDASI